jgi:hypothetical protein
MTNYVWKLKNKTTGELYPTYSYKTRSSARKAIKAPSGRLRNYYPVKVFADAPKKAKAFSDTFISPRNTITTPMAATTKASTGHNPKKGFGFHLVGKRPKAN